VRGASLGFARKTIIIPEMQLFNVINASTVLVENQTLGTSVKPFVSGGAGGTPSVILNPRMLWLNLQFKF
jgi:hypothetical protein